MLMNAAPGRRFIERWERHREAGVANRAVAISTGGIIILAGVIMLAVPGPGLVAVALGIGFLAGESRRLSRRLDRIELWGRRQVDRYWEPRSHKWAWGLLIASGGGIAFLVTIYLTYRYRDLLPLVG